MLLEPFQNVFGVSGTVDELSSYEWGKINLYFKINQQDAFIFPSSFGPSNLTWRKDEF
jgi:hypothetical protein